MSPNECVSLFADNFNAGRYDLLIDTFSFPLPVFVGSAASDVMARAEMWGFFQSLHSRMIAAGALRLEGRVVSAEMPLTPRHRIHVVWEGVGPGVRLPVMETVCYNTTSPDGLVRTEMLQITVAGDLRLGALLRAA